MADINMRRADAISPENAGFGVYLHLFVTIYEISVIITDYFPQSTTFDSTPKRPEVDLPRRLPGYPPEDLSSASIQSSRPPTWNAPIVGPTWLRAGRD